MYGVVTRNEEEVDWPEFDRGFYEVKDVTGRAADHSTAHHDGACATSTAVPAAG